MKKNNKLKTNKTIFLKSALALSIALPCMLMPVTLHAQLLQVVNTCGALPIQNPPTADQGGTLTIDVDGFCEFSSGAGSNSQGGIVLLDSGQDGLEVIFANGTTVQNNNDDDDNVVVFLDNNEDQNIVTVESDATILGEDGVIYIESDAATVNNFGIIENTGVDAQEGAIYIDRDADTGPHNINNEGTITTRGGAAIGADGLLNKIVLEVNNAAGAVISVTDFSDNGDSDAINLDGNPGDTGGQNRTCLETSQGVLNGPNNGTPSTGVISDFDIVQCTFDVAITNGGEISTDRDNVNNGAIRVEQDAVVSGTIDNLGGGVIEGAGVAINISGAHADHDLTINNEGTINGVSTAGIIIEGAGVSVNNQAGGVIQGDAVGLLVHDDEIQVTVGPNTEDIGDGSFAEIPFIEAGVLATNNTFVNAGTITGQVAAFDASGAATALTFEQQGGGSLLGDFIGSGGADTLNITAGTGPFTLTNDIFNVVNVNVASDATMAFSGNQTIEGDLVVDGTLELVLNNSGAPLLNVTGNVILNQNSAISVDVNSQVFAEGQLFTLMNIGGALINNSTLSSNVDETSFSLNFDSAAGNLVIEAGAPGVGPDDDEACFVIPTTNSVPVTFCL